MEVAQLQAARGGEAFQSLPRAGEGHDAPGEPRCGNLGDGCGGGRFLDEGERRRGPVPGECPVARRRAIDPGARSRGRSRGVASLVAPGRRALRSLWQQRPVGGCPQPARWPRWPPTRQWGWWRVRRAGASTSHSSRAVGAMRADRRWGRIGDGLGRRGVGHQAVSPGDTRISSVAPSSVAGGAGTDSGAGWVVVAPRRAASRRRCSQSASTAKEEP